MRMDCTQTCILRCSPNGLMITHGIVWLAHAQELVDGPHCWKAFQLSAAGRNVPHGNIFIDYVITTKG